jgi:hypothetical protein
MLFKLQIFNRNIFGGSMKIIDDESGQGAAEYILLFGGVIVIAVAAIVIYRAYFSGKSALKASTDVNKVRGSMTPRREVEDLILPLLAYSK